MLGERSNQRGLWEADSLYLDHVGRDSFYGILASLRGQLFRDSDFAVLYCADNGRDSVPPSLLATVLLLQAHDRVSDAEAKARADFDLRWKVALGIEVEDRPFAKSTLQVFRAGLILHDKVREVFERSLKLARESGYLKGKRMKVALDTTNILGRGAAEGHLQSAVGRDRPAGASTGAAKGNQRWGMGEKPGICAVPGFQRQGRGGHRLGRPAGPGSAVGWDCGRRGPAIGVVAAGASGNWQKTAAERQRIVAASELLGQLLLQDVERTEGGADLRDGVSRDRILSVHDPEMRHGHKSSSRRFDGHKAAVVVDTDSQLITAVDVLPGNAADCLGALELVEQSEASTGIPVEEAMGDAAYGGGDTRQAFADAGRRLVAKAPGRPNRTHFPKDDFRIDLESGSCTCPAGNVTRTMLPTRKRNGHLDRTYSFFRFDAAVCGACPVRPQCVAAGPGTGRTVRLHPQETLLQQAHALQQSEAFTGYRRRRVVVEHRLARLVQLGIRQSRYFGRAKTLFQLYLAATVANLTLVAAKADMTGETGSGPSSDSVLVTGIVNSAANTGAAWLRQIWTLTLLASALLPHYPFATRGFRPSF